MSGRRSIRCSPPPRAKKPERREKDRKSREKYAKDKEEFINKVVEMKEGEDMCGGVLATNVSDAQTRRIVEAFQGLGSTTSTPTTVPTREPPKKNVASATSINPYADNPRGNDADAVVDLSNALVLSKVVLCKYRFDENYLFSVERVELDTNEFNVKNYVAWSIKRCRVGENDEEMVADKTGKMVKRFAFSGKLASLPELHEAVYYLCLDSSIDTLISWEKAKQLNPDRFGVIDISTASRPKYSEKVYAFGPHRAYMDDVTYTNSAGQAIVYKALALTKWRNEKSKSKSKSDLDFFLLHIPARRMWHLLLAIELAMDLNNIKPKVPFTGGVIKREPEIEDRAEEMPSDDESSVDLADKERSAVEALTSLKRKRQEQLVSDEEAPVRKKRKAAKSASYLELSDSDSDFIPDDRSESPMLDDDGEDDDPTPSVAEEEREAADEPTTSDEEFIDDSGKDDGEKKASAKDKIRPVSDAADDKKKKKKKTDKNMSFKEVQHMYRKMMATKKGSRK